MKGTALRRRLEGVARPRVLCRWLAQSDRVADTLETHLDVVRMLDLAGVR